MIVYNKDTDAYEQLTKFIVSNNFSSIIVLCDTNTKKHCLNILHDEVGTKIDLSNIIEIKAGENTKTIETSIYILDRLLELGCDRKSLLINLGGGVVSDIGGFVASVFKRGFSFINIPTTLLSMVDASIGGKNGVDFNGIKNLIGTIKLPEMTVIDVRYLETLSVKELINGFAEMLKHALIVDKSHWDELIESNPLSLHYSQIMRSVLIKQKIVEEDINETGKRKLLNFGHSIGHAIEAYWLKNNKDILIGHGEAIAAGMIMESYISMHLGLLKSRDFEAIKNTLTRIFGIIQIIPSAFQSIVEFLRSDKKNRNNLFYFVLLESIGSALIDIQVYEKLVFDALDYYSKINITGFKKQYKDEKRH